MSENPLKVRDVAKIIGYLEQSRKTVDDGEKADIDELIGKLGEMKVGSTYSDD